MIVEPQRSHTQQAYPEQQLVFIVLRGWVQGCEILS